MRKLLTLLARIVTVSHGVDRLENELTPERLDAYCASCGGMTLYRDRAVQRIYCPQCDRSSLQP